MKISARRLKEIIKEEVQHVRTMPRVQEDLTDDVGGEINRIGSDIDKAASALGDLVEAWADVDDTVKLEYASESLAAIQAAQSAIGELHATLIPGAAQTGEK